jgi:hypothetical protein
MLLAHQEGSSIIFEPPRSVIIMYATDKHTPLEVILNGVVFRPSNRAWMVTERGQVIFFQGGSGSATAVKVVKRGNINDESITFKGNPRFFPDAWFEKTTNVVFKPRSGFVNLNTDLNDIVQAISEKQQSQGQSAFGYN